MPVPLIYDIGVQGEDRIKRVFKGIESEARANASRMAAESRRSVTARGTGDPSVRQAARGFEQIGRAARAADAAAIRARMAGDRRAAAERLRGIAREEREAVRAAERAAAATQRTASRIGSGIAATVGGSVKKVIGLGANALALGGGLLGGVAAGNAIESEIQIRTAASKLANQARRPELKGQLATEAKQVRGYSGTEALGALEQFVNITGDLDTARQLLPDLGKLALATGADLGELAATAGNAFIPVSDSLKGVSDPAERSRLQLEQMRDVMAALAGQGAVGAVEIKQLASYFAGLAATSNRFVGNKADLLKTMGAITQAARQRGGAADAAEAVTSTERFSSDVIKHSSGLAKLGIDVFSDKTHTQLADPQEIIQRVLAKTKGNLSTLGDVFGERGIRAIQGFSPLYTEAEKRKPGSGRAAVAAEFQRLMGAQFSTEDINRGAANRYSDEDVRLKEAQKEFNDAIGTKLLPVLTALIPKFTDLIPKVADAAGVLADFATNVINNPIPNIGALIAGKIALDLASAQIGEVVALGMGKIFAFIAAGGVTNAATGALVGAGTKLGLGAAGTAGLALGLSGAAAVGGIAATGYNAYKLNSEIDQLKSEKGNEGKSFWEIMSKGPSRGTSRDEYDALYGPGGKFAPGAKGAQASNPPASPINGQQVGRDIGAAAGEAISQKVAAISAASSVNVRRTNPIIDR